MAFTNTKLLEGLAHQMLQEPGQYATLHAGDYPVDERGIMIDDANIPELARTPLQEGIARFEALPECTAKHVAVWTKAGQLLLRAYCFPVEGFPEWAQERHIPEGGSVEVSLAAAAGLGQPQ